MNLSDLTNYVATKTQNVATDDLEAIKLFLSTRYELIYNSYLWKDSLCMVNVPFDPVNNQDNAEGIVILPQIIDRVVAVRTKDNSVRIHGLEDYYRVDYDAFTTGGTNIFGSAAEFAILSPLWFVFRGAQGLMVSYSSPATDTAPCKVIWRDSNGLRYVQLLKDSNLLTDSPLSTAPPDTNIIVITGAGTAAVNGTYIANGFSQWVNAATGILIEGSVGAGWLIAKAIPVTGYYTLPAGTASPISSNWTAVGLGVLPSPTTAYGHQCHLEVESVFKPATTGTVSFNPINAIDGVGQSLNPADTASQSYQRLRLFSIPPAAITLNVLGKKPFIPLDFDQEVPAIKNLDNVLIAWAAGDVLTRVRQFGKAAEQYKEATALLSELAKLETIQAANNCRFVPDAGYGDIFFGPSRAGYLFGDSGL